MQGEKLQRLKAKRKIVDELNRTIEIWFNSDLEIGNFILSRGREKLSCMFESDAWYEHINDPERDVTIKSIRHEGKHRRFIGVDGSDVIFNEVYRYCHQLYDKEELLDLVDTLAREYNIKWE